VPGAADQARRLAAQVQRFGLASAAAVVDRYVGIVDSAIGGTVVDALTGAGPGADREAVLQSGAAVAESYLRVLDHAANLAAGQGLASSPPVPDCVTVAATPPGGVGEATLWVHNPGAEAVTHLLLGATDLVCASGARLGSTALRTSPRVVDEVAAGGRVEVRLSVRVPADQKAGLYHGLLVVSGAPDEPLPVAVEVAGGPEAVG
jgi:hypothetical protein